MSMSIKEQFFQYIETRSISQTQASKALGYSPAVITAYKGDKYEGNVEEVERRMTAWLERETSRGKLLDIPIQETAILKQVAAACDIAYEETDIAVIVGYAGNGKSLALREYVRRHGFVYYLEANKSTSPHVLIVRLAEVFGLSVKGNAAEITARIATFLAGRDTLVIIDQADDLADCALEWLRQIVYDEGKTGLVLAGIPKLAGQIMNARNDHDQLLSRVGLYVRLPPVETPDMARVVRSVWPTISEEVEASFIACATLVQRSERLPSLRRLTKIMNRVHRVLYKNGLDLPSAEIVEHAARYIMNKDM
ncbi:MAG: hypothetical protein A2Y38_20200 [Spirochaetes bacterium GWB1_59_5]|nr:MAG: hypothetical protein A2Y38_20200 [Spirochaetes bacterium GWB1_59_5]